MTLVSRDQMPARTPYEAELRERLATAERQAIVYQRLAALQDAVVCAARDVVEHGRNSGPRGATHLNDLAETLKAFDREVGVALLASMPAELREALTGPSAIEEGLKAQKEPLFPGMAEPPGEFRSIMRTLQALVDLAWRHRDEPRYRDLARSLAAKSPNRHTTMELIIDELHRGFAYAPDPVKEYIGPVPFEPGVPVDADEACLFVLTLAMSVEIPCRIVGARYRQAHWTCFVAFKDETDTWNTVNPLRTTTDQVPSEVVTLGARIPAGPNVDVMPLGPLWPALEPIAALNVEGFARDLEDAGPLEVVALAGQGWPAGWADYTGIADQEIVWPVQPKGRPIPGGTPIAAFASHTEQALYARLRNAAPLLLDLARAAVRKDGG